MTTQPKEEEDQPGSSTTAVGLRGMVEQYHKIKENAETYPYVWASYIVVYGGFALWGAYRVRKLFKTEDRVRALQERLRKIVETEESASTATSVEKAPPAPDKTSK